MSHPKGGGTEATSTASWGQSLPLPCPRASWHILLTIGGFLLYIYIIYLFIGLFGFMSVLGIHSCVGFFIVALRMGSSPVVLCRLLIVMASPVAEHRLQALMSVVAACGLRSCGSGFT